MAIARMTAVHTQNGPQKPLRSGVDVVQLDVLVLDRDRRPVRGLAEQDFTIVERGQPRQIVGFSPIELAIRGSADKSDAVVESTKGVITNKQAESGRLVVIVFDRSIPAGPPTEAAKTIARAAVDALGPSDLAAVVRTSSFANEGKSQNFTRDWRLLREAVDSPFTGFVSPPVMMPGGLSAGRPDLQSTGDCVCGLCSLESLHRIADALVMPQRHQKVILFIASDIVISDSDATNEQCRGRVKAVREQTLRALDRANVTVHSIDPVGLEAPTSGVGAVERRFTAVREIIRARQANLAVLPSYTGGRFVRDTNAPSDVVPKIFSETTSYYLLGFERGGGASDARQHPVRVHVNRPGMTVVARKAYYPASLPPPVSTANSLEDSIAGLLPVSDIPLALSLASVFATSGQVKTNVAVGVGTASVLSDTATPFSTDANLLGARAGMEMILGVFDLRARQVSVVRRRVEPQQTSCDAGWCQFVSQITLEPGRYEVRVGVVTDVSSKRGSVYGYVDVPERRPDSFLLSDLQLSAGDLPTDQIAPSVRRTFYSQERLAIIAQVRRPLESSAPVTISVMVTDRRAEHVTQSSKILGAANFSASGVSEVRVDQSLSKFVPGAYVATIEATHEGRTARRNISFEVR